MKVAIIGAGTMGTVYARNLAKLPGVAPAGVCDLDQERADRAAALCGTTAYTDFDELLSKEQPEVVCVCLPTDLHKSYVLKLAALRVHVVCEKPIALKPEDAAEMQAACDQHQVRLFIGHVVRFFPSYRDAASKIRDGAIGEPRMAHFKRHGSYPQGSGLWYHDPTRSGGVILDLMIHDIDYACSIFGKISSVYASVSRTEQHEYAQVTLRFANRSIASLTGYWGYPGPFTTQFEISGTEGILRFDSEAAQSLDIKRHTNQNDDVKVQVPGSPAAHDPYYYELAHFLECIREGTEPIVSAEDARIAVAIAQAAERSAHEGEPVEVIV